MVKLHILLNYILRVADMSFIEKSLSLGIINFKFYEIELLHPKAENLIQFGIL